MWKNGRYIEKEFTLYIDGKAIVSGTWDQVLNVTRVNIASGIDNSKMRIIEND